jgi:hypothetical protein
MTHDHMATFFVYVKEFKLKAMSASGPPRTEVAAAVLVIAGETEEIPTKMPIEG